MASGSQSRRTSTGQHPSSVWWEEAILGDQTNCCSGHRRWSCKWCSLRDKVSGVDRVRGHLTREAGHEILSCDVISAEKRQQLREMVKTIDDQGIRDSFDPERKEAMDMAIGRFFWNEHIPFVKARSHHFKEMVQQIARHGIPYDLPTETALREQLLQVEKTNLEVQLAKVKARWKNCGVTLVADAWNDTRNRHIMGLVAYSRGQSTFLEAIDISSSGKTADNVFATWERGIEIVGEENVVLIVTDGEASNKAAARLLEARKPKIMWAPCLAHCLNNILKDFAKLPWMVGLLDKGKTLVGFLRNHSYLVAILASFSSRLSRM
ncbi:uncharacterized protein LOC112343709 [Selaginella moellendorffii]|uniref:uncharacterized protein LOC112343709 n=1 Tax=Selaginella moellendorffii TaxID=88036 RepID=UPI000D1C5A97|nr:uncharacterized protein LOC112343709 [Selaginella moellendorffii]|eukprot:XP_024523445.1 uncharacterized protein LOC112343709 [Selaginella moellendorffii]